MASETIETVEVVSTKLAPWWTFAALAGIATLIYVSLKRG